MRELTLSVFAQRDLFSIRCVRPLENLTPMVSFGNCQESSQPLREELI